MGERRGSEKKSPNLQHAKKVCDKGSKETIILISRRQNNVRKLLDAA